MVDFAGWAMPVQYTSIIEEHLAIRSAVGLADISHMGRLRFEGPGAAVFLAELLTRRVADLELGQIRYSLVTNDAGGILDDVLVGYYHNSHGQPFFMLVVNASNRRKIVDWVAGHLPKVRAEQPGQEIVWTDVSRLWAMFAIQGPKSVELLQPFVDVDLQSMRYYRGEQSPILHPAAERQGCIISRTGYTGEDGFEVSLGATIAQGVWEAVMEEGQSLGVVPAGFGAQTRYGSKPECRSTATSFPRRSTPSRPGWDSPATWSATIFPAATRCFASRTSHRNWFASV